MDVETQCQLIRDFMVALGPQVIVHSLANEGSITDGAELTLEAALQLTARYNQLRETLTAPTQNQVEKPKHEAPSAGAGVRKASARIPVESSDVSDLPGATKPGHTSPLSPDWRPPSSHR